MFRQKHELKDFPQLKKYMGTSKKRACVVTITDTFDINEWDREWSGGTKYYYTLYHPHKPPSYPSQSCPLAFGQVGVQSGTFCGKPSIPSLYMTKETYDHLLKSA